MVNIIEVSFAIYDSITEVLVGSGQGSGTSSLIWEGNTFSDGDTFWSGSFGIGIVSGSTVMIMTICLRFCQMMVIAMVC